MITLKQKLSPTTPQMQSTPVISHHNRDLIHVFYLLKLGYPLTEELIKERTGKSAAEYLRGLGRFIEKNFPEKNILYGLGEVLEEKQKEWDYFSQKISAV